jgi:radical SAM superfamily enzyme YgiQ (UPF0313 family)
MARRRSKNLLTTANRKLIEKELATLPTPPHEGDMRVHLVYPNSYWVAMSNLGFQAVYGIFGSSPGVAVERAFLTEDEKQRGKTFESGRHLYSCDVIGFSLSFETDYPHLIQILDETKMLIPDALERARRADTSRFEFPLLIAGGTAVTLNPEPVADLFDCIVLGEAEELIPEFVACFRTGKEQRLSRLQLLKELAKIEGVYVPAFYQPHYLPGGELAGYKVAEELFRGDNDEVAQLPERAARRFVSDLSKYPTFSRILTSETEFSSMFLTETGRGCEMGCRFCVAGYIYRPVRKRSEESIRDSVKIGLENSEAIGFVGAAVSSHKAISKLTKEVSDSGARASLSSLMSQKINKQLAASLSESEYKTISLAPEAGGERLRRAAGKRVSDEEIISAAQELAEGGIRGFKLYFIVGLPTETESETDDIATLAKRVRDAVTKVSLKEGRAAWVQLSVNPFIPKASTPFQWEPMVKLSLLEKKIERLKELIKGEDALELRYEPPRESYFQALLSRGDRKVLNYLLLAHKLGESWKWILKHGEEALASTASTKPEAPQPPPQFYIERRIPFDEFLPWDIINSRIDKQLLKREALRAHLGESYGRDSPRDGVASCSL